MKRMNIQQSQIVWRNLAIILMTKMEQDTGFEGYPDSEAETVQDDDDIPFWYNPID